LFPLMNSSRSLESGAVILSTFLAAFILFIRCRILRSRLFLYLPFFLSILALAAAESSLGRVNAMF
jgi:hypothetical protein